MVANSVMGFFPVTLGHVTTDIDQVKDKTLTHTQDL
jgi:hypothetical protein